MTLAHDEEINNGNLTVTSGTLDLSSFRMDRVSNGGTLTVADGAFLKIGGTNTFPVRFVTHLLGPTSTVEYYGTTQVVTPELYGHLILSDGSTKRCKLLLTEQPHFLWHRVSLPGRIYICKRKLHAQRKHYFHLNAYSQSLEATSAIVVS